MKLSRLKTLILGISVGGVAVAAVSPAIFPTLPGPVGLSATTTQVLYSHPFCQTVTGTRMINNFSSNSLYATLPDQLAGADLFRTCAENYLAISTGLGGFPAGATYVFAVVGQNPANPASGTDVVLREPGNTVFATLPAGFAPVNHAFISFDTVGTFGFNMIVTGQNGIIGYNSAGAIAFQYANPLSGTYALEGATVAPLTYAGCPGCLFVTAARQNANGAILVAAPGASALTVWSTNVPSEPESIQFVPAQPCSFDGFSYFVSGFNTGGGTGAFSNTGAILAYTAAQLAPYAGQFLIPDEASGVIYAYSGPNTSTVFSNTGYQLEGAQLVQCAPGTGCPATQGYWKHHTFPANMFDASGKITIGTASYTASQLVDILNTAPTGGNAVLILGHQLIAAIANVAAGAQVTPEVAQAIAQAEALFTSNNLNLSSTVKSSTTLGQQMVDLSTILDNYNSAVGLNCSEGSGLQ